MLLQKVPLARVLPSSSRLAATSKRFLITEGNIPVVVESPAPVNDLHEDSSGDQNPLVDSAISGERTIRIEPGSIQKETGREDVPSMRI
jgi:hypothetical protein